MTFTARSSAAREGAAPASNPAAAAKRKLRRSSMFSAYRGFTVSSAFNRRPSRFNNVEHRPAFIEHFGRYLFPNGARRVNGDIVPDDALFVVLPHRMRKEPVLVPELDGA